MTHNQNNRPLDGWIDAHCHLAHSKFDDTLEATLERSRQAGVTAWVQGGICPDDWEIQSTLRQTYGDSVILTFGLHPWWIAKNSRFKITEALNKLASRLPDAHGLGELGLDFLPKHTGAASHDSQLEAFELQLTLAKSAGKPLVLHVVHAHEPALLLLKKHAPYPDGGMVHSFSASAEIGRRYVDLGFLLSLGGSITRPGFAALKHGLADLPRDRFVVETDAPDQTPVLPGVLTGSANEPAYLVGIADALSPILGLDRDAILWQSARNLKTLFRI